MAIGPLAGIAIARRHGFAVLFAVSALSALVALCLSTATRETLERRAAVPFGLSATLSRAAALPSAVVLCLMVTYGAQVSFLPIHADRQGMNPGLFFLFFALVVALVRSHAGRLSDRLGRVPVVVSGLALSAVAVAGVAFTSSIVGLSLAGIVYGVGFGTAQPALIAWTVDGVPAVDRGRAMGTYYTALELGVAIGAVGAGLAVAAVGFAGTFLTVAGVAAAGAALALAPRAHP
jgi:predicted MFS family arabinose efflux permease